MFGEEQFFPRADQKALLIFPGVQEINCQRHKQFWSSVAHILDSAAPYLYFILLFFTLRIFFS